MSQDRPGLSCLKVLALSLHGLLELSFDKTDPPQEPVVSGRKSSGRGGGNVRSYNCFVLDSDVQTLERLFLFSDQNRLSSFSHRTSKCCCVFATKEIAM